MHFPFKISFTISCTKSLIQLLHTSDKALPSAQATAHTKFQEIAFAYAILSDPHRRARYDATGSTANSLDAGLDPDFNWTDFFRQQFAELVTTDRVGQFKSTYQHSAEETSDLLAAYKKSKGKMNAIFRTVMLSDILEDEDRFRAIIDGAIARGEVEAYDAYTNEPAKARALRRSRAQRERKGAEKHAKKLGVYEKVFGEDVEGKRGQKRKKEPEEPEEPDLAALIQKKAKERASTFLENLEAKYTNGAKGGKKGQKSKKHEEPPEEAFRKTAARVTKRKQRSPTPQQEDEASNDDEEEDGDEVDLSAESLAEDEDDNESGGAESEDEEEEEVAPRKRRRVPQRKIPARRGRASKKL